MFTTDQVNDLLDIIKQNNIVYISKHLGKDYLTRDEILRLKNIGINPDTHYDKSQDVAELSFHFGLISDALGDLDLNKTSYKDLENYFKQGDYIPLTKEEKYVLDSIKRQNLKDIKGLEGRIFNDINQTILKEEKNNRKSYEDVIRNEVLSGVEKKKTVKQIARELKEKTGDWSRDFEKSVHFISHQAFDEGRAMYYEGKFGDDVKVFKKVYPGACPICIKLYLTGDINSQPKIFKLSDLKANGTNIGRKTNEWKPVLGATHVYCRCTLNIYNENYDWSKEKRAFSNPNGKVIQLKTKRKPIRITFMGKEYAV